MKVSVAITLLLLVDTALAFIPGPAKVFGVTRLHAATETDIKLTEEVPVDDQQSAQAVRAPLKYIGPYPCLSLRFPNLSTQSQRARNVSGISLDFVLDTAANINIIQAQVASELGLEKVGEAPGGFDVGGTIQGGETFLLGDCELEGLQEEDQFTFMKNLTASSLPVASPGSAGLLSLAFFNCFPGGAQFEWGQAQNGTLTVPPSVTFFGDDDDSAKTTDGMSRVTIEPLPVTLLPSVTVEINGVPMPALLDTGAPITVLNAQAAKIAGVQTAIEMPPPKSSNPFSNFANNLKIAQAAASGDVLPVGGGPDGAINLYKSEGTVDVAVVGEDGDPIRFGQGPLFVGDLPGLAALNGIGEDAPPAVVLGMDVLRTKRRMLYRGQQNEVYFER